MSNGEKEWSGFCIGGFTIFDAALISAVSAVSIAAVVVDAESAAAVSIVAAGLEVAEAETATAVAAVVCGVGVKDSTSSAIAAAFFPSCTGTESACALFTALLRLKKFGFCSEFFSSV